MLHLAYQPLLPTGSKYLQLKWDQKNVQERVKNAYQYVKDCVSVSFPKHIHPVKLEEQRMMKIQKENNMLLEKISHIMRTTGRIDNRNDYERKSLGRERRQLEMLRITKENQMILFRLSQCRPHYNVRIWHEDWLKTLKVMDSIARYPRGWAQQQKVRGFFYLED
uniref:CFAP97 domain containing 2 n=1 Tax=Myripristis murdjan TaxID=586833 RepID=A0A668AC60_9TELE